MKISTRVRYGARAMLDLALHAGDGPLPLSVLADEQRMPERYLSKIIQDLRRQGLIQSVRGAGGGYRLTKDPEAVTLLDVWKALEGPLNPVDCVEHPDECPMEPECVTRRVWVELGQKMESVLEQVTLADLVHRHGQKVG